MAEDQSKNLQFHMWNYKIAMATFRMTQCQDGDELLNVMNEDVKAF